MTDQIDIITEDEMVDFRLEAHVNSDTSELVKILQRMKTDLMRTYSDIVDNPSTLRVGNQSYNSLVRANKIIVMDSYEQIRESIIADALQSSASIASLYSDRGYEIAKELGANQLLSKVVLGGSTTVEAALRNLRQSMLTTVNTALISSLNMSTKKSYKEQLNDKLNTSTRATQTIMITTNQGAMNYTESKIASVNKKVMKYKRYNATFENTCPRCSTYDGSVYLSGGGIYLPQHGNCRCYYTYFASEVKTSPPSIKERFKTSEEELQRMFGKNLGSAIHSGKIDITDVIKTRYNSRGEIVDVKQLGWAELKGKVKK